MKYKRICILGGTGFVGAHLTARLAARHMEVKILTRNREKHRDLFVLPGVSVVNANVHDVHALIDQFKGCDAVINLVGVLHDARKQGFEKCHEELPANVISACQDVGIQRLLHMSALHADTAASSAYLRSRGRGEALVSEWAKRGMKVTVFRPSVIFGPGDSFFNRFYDLLKLSPVLVPLACSGARFAPVYVGDVVTAFERAFDDGVFVNKHFNLCGPRVYSLREVVEYVMHVTGVKRRIVPLGPFLSRLQARFLQRLPGKVFTMDNYRSLQVDSVCEGEFPAEFGLQPVAVESVVPYYLRCGGRNKRLDDFRRAAHRL